MSEPICHSKRYGEEEIMFCAVSFYAVFLQYLIGCLRDAARIDQYHFLNQSKFEQAMAS